MTVVRRRPIHCLVAEPQTGMRMLLDDLLSVSDVIVTAVSTDAEALKALKVPDAKFQVVVCPAPPVGAKHSLVAKIRNSSGPVSKLPVVCLSPSRGLQERAMAYESGASEYLELPVSPVLLADTVHHWASVKKQHQPY